MACDQGCSTVDTILDRVAGLLNDRDPVVGSVRWPRADLIGYLNEGLCELSAHKPDAFASVVDLVLKPGSLQKLSDKFKGLAAIEAHYSKDGEKAVSESNYRYAKIFKRKPCLARHRCSGASGDPCRDYVLKSYVKNPIDDTAFTVDPPIPAGCAITVKATVYSRPQRFCSADGKKCLGVGCEFEAQLVDWMLYRAFSVDTESTQMREASKMHYELFVRALDRKMRVEDRLAKMEEDDTPRQARTR
jgi:hypothetical protein